MEFPPDRIKDKYGNEVSRLARPLPVEYLLVDVPAATPLTPVYTFPPSPPNTTHFPVENRMVDGHVQDFNALSRYLAQFSPDQFHIAINDFHLLIYIATMDMMPMRDSLGPLLAAIGSGDPTRINAWPTESEQWATLEQLIAASAGHSAEANSLNNHTMDSIGGGDEWTCPHCTLLNSPHVSVCDACTLPR
ncbi:hypothetical protein M8J77_017423 [Diaphorina citri]|nr:hypothetical protein M8J77_017423 [Diaphorina citri]